MGQREYYISITTKQFVAKKYCIASQVEAMAKGEVPMGGSALAEVVDGAGVACRGGGHGSSAPLRLARDLAWNSLYSSSLIAQKHSTRSHDLIMLSKTKQRCACDKKENPRPQSNSKKKIATGNDRFNSI
jgi:hypothetical protein